MSRWPGKYVIGLTGNIATGKSVVRKMLEHLGAYSIDADALAHRATAKDAPAYQQVVDGFGKWILDANDEIDRKKLGQLVFSNPDALQRLEAIVHPLVENAIDLLIQRATQKVVVIEAIKLLEGGLVGDCDAIWVSHAPEAIQKSRLMLKRGMNESEALQRIRAQASQEKKTAAAQVVIQNAGSFEDTWKQVVAAWKDISPASDAGPVVVQKAADGVLSVQRGRPRDSASIAALITRLSNGKHPMTPDDVMAAFGEKAYLLLMSGQDLVGLVGWQVENLVARTTELHLHPEIPIERALSLLVSEVEQASHDLQCEASLFFVPASLAGNESILKELGYSKRTPQTLGFQAWQDAAVESQEPDTVMFFKQLRHDRVLRPI